MNLNELKNQTSYDILKYLCKFYEEEPYIFDNTFSNYSKKLENKTEIVLVSHQNSIAIIAEVDNYMNYHVEIYEKSVDALKHLMDNNIAGQIVEKSFSFNEIWKDLQPLFRKEKLHNFFEANKK